MWPWFVYAEHIFNSGQVNLHKEPGSMRTSTRDGAISEAQPVNSGFLEQTQKYFVTEVPSQSK